ncbi:MAG: tetratricopeptide repeat protein [Desulfobacteraceae bacterium]|nr:MAG: tetratricopeptide repeat protein [Desulfobacteraceae bacterium]
MSPESKVLKGYVKTENMIFLLVAALALGFIGGVVFSAYRLGGTPVPETAAPGAQTSVNPQQKEMFAALLQRTEANPKDVDAWTQLGHLYFDTDQPAKAIEAYETSLTLAPDRPDVWTDLGVMYRRKGEPQQAIEKFDRALSLQPDHQIALFNKGIVMMHDLKDPKGALDAWQKLLAINPNAQTPAGEPLKNIIEQLQKGGAS